MILGEVALQNVAAADAISPVWEQLLAPSNTVATSYRRGMGKGAVRSSWFVYGLFALRKIVVEDPRTWATVSDLAKSIFGADDALQTAQLLDSDQERAIEFTRLALDREPVYVAWCKELLAGILYENRADVVAAFIKAEAETLEVWKSEVAALFTRDPRVASQLISSLGTRRAGDANWTARVGWLSERLSAVVIGDRVFFEQLLAAPQAGWRDELRATAKEELGQYIDVKWTDPQ